MSLHGLQVDCKSFIVGSVLPVSPVARMIHKDIVLKGVLGQLLLQVFVQRK